MTHGVTYLSKMDLIVVMKDGEISEIGGYEELLERQGAFSEFIHIYLVENQGDLTEHENPEGNTYSIIF